MSRDTVYSEEWLAERLSKMKQKPQSPDVAEAAKRTQQLESTPSKYKNKKTVVDGITFDSKKEAARYSELKLLERQGAIKDLALQVRIPLEVNHVRVCIYVCDFQYSIPARSVLGLTRWVFEDCKGMRTPVYILKKKLVKAILGIEILET